MARSGLACALRASLMRLMVDQYVVKLYSLDVLRDLLEVHMLNWVWRSWAVLQKALPAPLRVLMLNHCVDHDRGRVKDWRHWIWNRECDGIFAWLCSAHMALRRSTQCQRKRLSID